MPLQLEWLYLRYAHLVALRRVLDLLFELLQEAIRAAIPAVGSPGMLEDG